MHAVLRRRLANDSSVPVLNTFIQPTQTPCLCCRWVLFVDERNVPLSSDDSNYKGAQQELLSKVRQGGAAGWRAAAGGLE